MKSKKSIQALAARLMADRVMLPEMEVNGVKIEHVRYSKGAPIMLVNFRVAMLCGWPPCEYIAPEPTVIHVLSEKGEGCWMTDMPCELVQMHYELARHARGDVLIGGLGLGIVARMCARKRNVKNITIVESSKEIVDALWPKLRPLLGARCFIEVADIHDYAARCAPFDVALLDTWQGTGEMVWTGDVVPLRRKLWGKTGKIHCWQEKAMHTQMGRPLFRVSAMKSPDAVKDIPHYYAFWKGLEREGIKRKQVDGDPGSVEFMAASEEAMHENAQDIGGRSIASVLLHMVGSGYWERLFGKAWDESVQYAAQVRAGWKEKEKADALQG